MRPQHGDGRKNPRDGLFGMEVKDDDFLGLVQAGFPFALADGISAGLSQHRVSAEDHCGFHDTVRTDHGFDFH
jgi:hypothetical protein